MINHFQAILFVTPSSALQIIKGMGGWNRIQIWEQEKLPAGTFVVKECANGKRQSDFRMTLKNGFGKCPLFVLSANG